MDEKSDNGLFLLSVSDSGITISGPQGSVVVDESGVKITSQTGTSIMVSGASVDIEAIADIEINAPTVIINGRPVSPTQGPI